ncbi:MAG: tRNA lysidine(34) synthetase TilS, partial [Acidobacteriota bacterium]
MAELEETVRKTIESGHLLCPDSHVLVALSGGPDSVALLHVLKALQETFSHDLSAAHVNHHLRGEESDQDEEFVRELCAEWDLPLETHHLQLPQGSGYNLEEAARSARYDCLAATADRLQAVLATGHTLDDQVETFLMRLFRGAGCAGLSGIYLKRVHHLLRDGKTKQIPVIRPLLYVSRNDLLDYLRLHRVPYRVDQTNYAVDRDRNWIRHELIPTLEERFNPKLKPVLSRTAALLRETDDFLNREVSLRLSEIGSASEEGLSLPISDLENLLPIVRKQLVRHVLRDISGTLRGVNQGHIESVLELTTGQSGRSVTLPGGMVITREFDALRFSLNPLPVEFLYQVEVPTDIEISEVGKRIVFAEASVRSKGVTIPGERVIVRNRRPGDRFRAGPKARTKT